MKVINIGVSGVGVGNNVPVDFLRHAVRQTREAVRVAGRYCASASGEHRGFFNTELIECESILLDQANIIGRARAVA